MYTSKVELIPVVEIFLSNSEIELPDNGPSWEYQDEWEDYNQKCLEFAGFSKEMHPYRKATSYYEVNKMTKEDVVQLILLEIEKQQSDEENGIEDVTSAFSGGFVLRINDETILFPQCCSDLSDLSAWKYLLEDENTYFYSGHPSPKVTRIGEELLFDFVNTEISEQFAPPVPCETIKITIADLISAIENAENELEKFSKMLEETNKEHKIGFKTIAEILVYGKYE